MNSRKFVKFEMLDGIVASWLCDKSNFSKKLNDALHTWGGTKEKWFELNVSCFREEGNDNDGILDCESDEGWFPSKFPPADKFCSLDDEAVWLGGSKVDKEPAGSLLSSHRRVFNRCSL